MVVDERAMLERVSGQPRVAGLLSRAITSGRVAHAWAFIGPPGSGRTTAARVFAAMLLCEHGGCGTCRACRVVAAGQHPDVHVIVPTPPVSNPRGTLAIRIDAVRELERQAALRPVMAARKVFVIDDADRMTGETPQAFLKTLEEPPDRTVIILVLDRARAVPPTVLSRCQIVRFDPPPDAAPDDADALALLADVRESGITAAFARFDRSRPDRADAEATVDAWWRWCRDVLLAKAGASAAVLTAPDRVDALGREADRWTIDDLVSAIAACRSARESLAVNVSPRLTLEVLLARLALRVP
jgi:DNA polymerase-3 subunit delta'